LRLEGQHPQTYSALSLDGSHCAAKHTLPTNCSKINLCFRQTPQKCPQNCVSVILKLGETALNECNGFFSKELPLCWIIASVFDSDAGKGIALLSDSKVFTPQLPICVFKDLAFWVYRNFTFSEHDLRGRTGKRIFFYETCK
jgi:hypothetical protein